MSCEGDGRGFLYKEKIPEGTGKGSCLDTLCHVINVMHRKNTHMPLVGDPDGGGVHLGHHPATRDSNTGRRKEGGHQLATAWEEKKSHTHFPMDQHVFPPKSVERKREGNGTTRDEAAPVPHPMSATY